MAEELVFHPEDVVGLDMRYAVQAQYPDLFSEFMEAAADAMAARLREAFPDLEVAWSWDWGQVTEEVAGMPEDAEAVWDVLAEYAVEDAVDRVFRQRGLVLR